MKPLKTFVSIQLILCLSLSMLAMQGCPKKTPASQLVVAARVFASAPVVLKSLKETASVLTADGTLSIAALQRISASVTKAKKAVDNIAGDVEAGKLDAVAWDNALGIIETEVTAALAEFGKVIDPRITEIIALGKILVPQIRAVIKQLQPAASIPTPALDAAAKAYKKNAITPAQIITIAIIATEAGYRLISIRQDTDAASLWAKFHTYSQGF